LYVGEIGAQKFEFMHRSPLALPECPRAEESACSRPRAPRSRLSKHIRLAPP